MATYKAPHLNNKCTQPIKIAYRVPLLAVRLMLLFASTCFCDTISHAQAKKSAKAPEKTKFDSSFFTDVNKLTQSDYLSALQKVFDIQNKVPSITNSFSKLYDINEGLATADSAIGLIKKGLSSAESKALNLQDLQMFSRLMDELNDNTSGNQEIITGYEKSLNGLKKEIADIRKDTVLRHIFSTPELCSAFLSQIEDLRGKWDITDSLVRLNTTAINNTKAHNSKDNLLINDLLFKIDNLLQAAGTNAFGKEHRYLWEPRKINADEAASSFKNEIETENKITNYYFKNVKVNRFLLWSLSIVFFWWVFYNFKSLNRLNRLSAISVFGFKYIKPHPVLASLIFILCLAPLFDMSAPVIYSDCVAFATIVALTLFFFKRLPHPYLLVWCGFVMLFLTLPLLDVLALPFHIRRWWMLTVNSASVAYSFFVLFFTGKKKYRFRYIFVAGVFYAFLNFLAILCNLFGRVTLTQIFYSTGVYAFIQAIALTILIKIMTEAFLLQIAGSRARKGYREEFKSDTIIKGVNRTTSIVSVIFWLVVLTDNLNIYDTLVDIATSIFTSVHNVGSFSFTLGGIILFIGIIWVANFLQKNIASFFGDIGDDILIENKTERSRLLVTRLILLIIGFLLAVAALGLPIAQITVILGALGIGIGLGLQNIVNNFVSGIILIFDRTLRIGDIVELSDKKGRVKEIGIRASTLLTDEGAEVVIPNGDILSKNITNWTLSNNLIRVTINLQLARPFSMDTLVKICSEEVLANKMAYSSRPPEIFVTAITPTSENIRIFFWCNNISRTEKTYSEVYTAIYDKLTTAGISLL